MLQVWDAPKHDDFRTDNQGAVCSLWAMGVDVFGLYQDGLLDLIIPIRTPNKGRLKALQDSITHSGVSSFHIGQASWR